MKSYKIIFLLLSVIVVGILACNKESAYQTSTVNNIGTAKIAADAAATSICDQFSYPDTIFYQKQSGKDYIVKPLKPLTGRFGAFPTGLSINTLNGNINITKSETGLEYMVWFIPQGSTDTCIKYITVAGIDYKDSIYVLANNPSISIPIYNADPSKVIDCSGGCEFDDGPDDDNGNGISDEPPAGQQVIPQGLAINKKTGAINFKKSLQNGVFGKNPLNGTYKDFILNYRMGDKSAKALNKIALRIYYFKSQSQIPAELLDELSTKEGQVLLEGEEDEDDDHGGHHGSGNSGSGKDRSTSFRVAVSSATTAKHGAGEVKCRPPYIIVTQQ